MSNLRKLAEIDEEIKNFEEEIGFTMDQIGQDPYSFSESILNEALMFLEKKIEITDRFIANQLKGMKSRGFVDFVEYKKFKQNI